MRVLKEIQSHDALLIADRYKTTGGLAGHRALALTDRIDDLLDQLDALPAEALSERLRILEDIRKLRLEIMRELGSRSMPTCATSTCGTRA